MVRWGDGLMLVVGLTGGIASGKSTVSRMFSDAGVPVICADELAREAVKAGSPALEEVKRAFGECVVGADGELDRVTVARLVFSDELKRKALEAIIHPRVSAETNRRIRELEAQGYELVLVDVPLLYESGWDQLFDLIIVVYVPEALQATRLSERNGMNVNEVADRLRAQLSIEEKTVRADIVVDNSGTVNQTRQKVQEVLAKLYAAARDGEPRPRGRTSLRQPDPAMIPEQRNS